MLHAIFFAVAAFGRPLVATLKPQVNATTLVYPPVNRCIYCDALWGDFGREHIIPEALGGNFILRASSCFFCAAIINDEVEGPLLKTMFGPLRAKFDLPTKSGRKDSYSVWFGRSVDGHFEETHSRPIPNQELPDVFVGLLLGAPGILFGHRPSTDGFCSPWVKVNTKEVDRLTGGEGGMRVANLNNLLFCRMLAKIAHAYATAELGYGNFRPLLRDLILGRSRTPTHWIGGGGGQVSEPEEKGLHRLRRDVFRSRTGKTYYGVNIRLFAPHGTPEYNIIVGECPTNERSVIQKIRDAKGVKFFFPPRKFIPRTYVLFRISRRVKSLHRLVKTKRKSF